MYTFIVSTNSGQPFRGQAWFDFNDSRVHPIYEKSLEKQFSGRESAYMLFYRRRSLVRPNKGKLFKSMNKSPVIQ